MNKYDLLFKANKFAISVAGVVIALSRSIDFYLYLNRKIKRNENLKKNRNTERCYICGLGPSLRNIDFGRIKDDLIVVNRFNAFDKNAELDPKYYCIADNAFFTEESIIDFEKAFEQYPNSNFIVNSKYHKIIDQKTNKSTNVFFASMNKGIFSNKSKVDFTKNLPVFGNVISFAICTAIYAGYKEIILIGCDFNSFASQKSVHCYDEKNSERKISLAFELFSYSFVADSHYELELYSIKNGINIINATPDSLIDAYKRVKIENLYEH